MKKILPLIYVLMLAMLATSGFAAITDGLIAYWGFDDSNVNISVNSVSGAPNITWQGTTSIVGGFRNTGRKFTTGNYGDSGFLQQPSVIRTMCLAMNASPITTRFAWGARTVGTDQGRYLGESSSVIRYTRMYNAAANNIDYTTTTIGVWHYVCIVEVNATGTQPNIYIDGVLTANTTSNQSFVNANCNAYIGGVNYCGSGMNLGYNGTVDSVGYWNRILNASEIAALNSSFGDPYYESVPPIINRFFPTNSTNYTTTGVAIAIYENITDNTAVSSAWAIVTQPNSTQTTIALLQNGSTSIYNATYTLPSTQGRYNISFYGNDTSANNATVIPAWFFVDSIPPGITITSPANNLVYSSTPITLVINATVTDTNAISEVNCTIHDATPDDGDHVHLSFVSGNAYSGTYVSDATDGSNFNYTCIAADVYGNTNTTATQFFSVDTHVPVLSDPKPATASVLTTANVNIDLGINITTGGAGSLSTTIANVTMPNGTKSQVTLTNSAGTKYNSSYSIGSVQGRYNVTYYAEKSSGLNAAYPSYFYLDSVAPSIITDTPSTLTIYSTLGSVVGLIVNVSDATFSIDHVTASIVYPDASVHNFTMVPSANQYAYNYTTIDNMDGYYNVTFVVYDQFGVTNSSTAQFYLDAHLPSVSNPIPANNVVFNATGAVQVGITATDSQGVNASWVTIVAPDSNTQTISLVHQSANLWNSTYTVNHGYGVYNATWYANDSVNHQATPLTSQFYLDDRYPIFSNLTSNTQQLLWNGIATFGADVSPTNNTVYLTFNGTNYLANKSGSHYFYSRFVTFANYSYNWTAYGDGVSHHAVTTNTSLYEVNFTPDVTPPNVTLISPGYGQNYSIQSNVLLSLTVVDDRQVGLVWGIVTAPNGSTEQIFMPNTEGDTYSGFYMLPATGTGNYIVNFTAQDATGNNNTAVNTLFVYVAPKTGLFNINSCPDTATSVQMSLYLGILFFLGGAIFMSFIIKQPIVGVLACLGLMFFGFMFVGCSVGLGMVIIGLAVLLMVVSIFQ